MGRYTRIVMLMGAIGVTLAIVSAIVLRRLLQQGGLQGLTTPVATHRALAAND